MPAHLIPNCLVRALFLGLLACAPRPATAFDPLALPNPFPRPLELGEQLQSWDFTKDTAGWQATHHCNLTTSEGVLHISCLGNDPYLVTGVRAPGGTLLLQLRVKASASGNGQVFWSSSRQSGFTEANSQHFPMHHDGQWHEYAVPLEVDGELRALRLDPGGAPGPVDVAALALRRTSRPPLEIAAFEQQAQAIKVFVRNHAAEALNASVNGQPLALAAGAVGTSVLNLAGQKPLESLTVSVTTAGLKPTQRSLWVYRPQAALDCVTRSRGPVTIAAARDGSVVRILHGGQAIAALAPLVHCDNVVPQLTLAAEESGPLTFSGAGLTAKLELTAAGELTISIRSDKPVEGPVVRAFGEMEQGLFAGLEYLERGDHSSSKLDIESEEFLRFAPDPMKVTMPLLASVTDRGSVALLWQDPALQPTCAMPDFVDGTTAQRFSLRGAAIDAVLRCGPAWGQGGRLEDAIVWAVKRRGLPPVPPAPRTWDEQMKLSLAAYDGLIRSPQGGWHHAIVPGQGGSGQHFADHASAIFRITGRVPELPQLVFGGAHISNSASYFVTGRADQWLQIFNGLAAARRHAQQADGSYHYGGPYRRGHFEDTANGICARPASELLEHAWYTGDPQSLAAGLKTLQYMKRFRTPRGAQTWEIPLHTPDILASGYLVEAYVRGYELTGDKQWLEEARRWAISGMPFVYQWSNRPIMLYATTPVYGATFWKAPNWMGLPVQWCGTVYAYSLLKLAPHDQTLDWRKIATGILVAGEQMQYPDGVSRGCLPDSFQLSSQTRLPSDINPGALVSLRLLVAGKLDALAVAVSDQRRVVAPFPVTIRDGRAHVSGVSGLKYQVLIDGRRIVSVTSQGEDVVPLD